MATPLVSIVTPCFNEAENVQELCSRIRQVMDEMPEFRYEHIFIDNCSEDRTTAMIKEVIAGDKRVRLISNTRNFGHIRSPYHGLLQAQGDVVIMMASDLQDPPELIPAFLQEWKQGKRIVVGVKVGSQESRLLWLFRSVYYRLARKMADIKLLDHVTGFGLYDRVVVEIIRSIDDRYPYFRGLIADIGYDIATIPYTQPERKRGITKNNFYTLYDFAMLGIVSHSKVPIRLATMAGFGLAVISMLISIVYLVLKIAFWDSFGFGLAPVLVGLFFFSSVQLFFIGIIGEYVGSIHTHVMKRPLVVERERVNFDSSPIDKPSSEA